jgi:hypothetical protein
MKSKVGFLIIFVNALMNKDCVSYSIVIFVSSHQECFGSFPAELLWPNPSSCVVKENIVQRWRGHIQRSWLYVVSVQRRNYIGNYFVAIFRVDNNAAFRIGDVCNSGNVL